LKNTLISIAACIVLSGASGGFFYWKGLENGKDIAKGDCQGGEVAGATENAQIAEDIIGVYDYRPSDAAFLGELRDDKAAF
jgi:hypothetical protein